MGRLKPSLPSTCYPPFARNLHEPLSSFALISLSISALSSPPSCSFLIIFLRLYNILTLTNVHHSFHYSPCHLHILMLLCHRHVITLDFLFPQSQFSFLSLFNTFISSQNNKKSPVFHSLIILSSFYYSILNFTHPFIFQGLITNSTLIPIHFIPKMTHVILSFFIFTWSAFPNACTLFPKKYILHNDLSIFDFI